MVKRTASALSSIASSIATYFWNGFYSSLDPSRKEVFNTFKPRGASVHEVTAGSFSGLSAQCRHLERTTPMGRAVCEGHSADIVGSGIGILPNTGDDELDAILYKGFTRWAEHALADGSSLWTWQSLGPRELDTSGQALARILILPERIAKGWLPVCILPLEAEWLAEFPVDPVPDGYRFIRGVIVDKLGRPAFYDLRNPETLLSSAGERVPADEIIHCFERRRPQQVIGEPNLAPVVERLLQCSRLIETELKAANATAAPAVAITSQGGTLRDDGVDDDGDAVTDIPAGSVVRLDPGEALTTVTNNRPSQQIAPFLAVIRGEVAAATKCSQFWLDRDPARANFSSMRMDQLLTKRALANLKETIGAGMAGRPYEAAVKWILLEAGIAMPSSNKERAALYEYLLRPDQPEYVEPVKDVAAARNAIAENLSTYDIELSARNKDYRQVFKQRQVENKLLSDLGLPTPQPEKAAPAAATDAGGQAPDNPDNPDNADTADELGDNKKGEVA